MFTRRCCRNTAARRRFSGRSLTATRVTGVTTMLIDAGLDTGDMLLKAETPIGPEETALELGERLAVIGADLLVETLRRHRAATRRARAAERRGSDVRADSEEGRRAGSTGVCRRTRSTNRRGDFCRGRGAYTTFRGQVLHIWRAKPANDISSGFPGSVYAAGRRLLVACGQGTSLEIEELQLEGRKRMTRKRSGMASGSVATTS